MERTWKESGFEPRQNYPPSAIDNEKLEPAAKPIEKPKPVLTEQKHIDGAKNILECYDTDRNKKLDKIEFKTYLENERFKHSIHKAMSDIYFEKRFDMNGDGELTTGEIAQYIFREE